jgi:hypothetical protein
MEMKKLIAGAVRYRDEVGALLQSLDANDIEQGRLVLKASLISRDLKPFVLSQAGEVIRDYRIKFENGKIGLWASIDAKQLGPVEVEYEITVSELRFNGTGHKLYATFRETTNPTGNMVQKIAFKAALINGPLIKTAVQMGNISFVYVDGNNLLIDFDQMGIAAKLPDDLTLNYISSKDTKLTLSLG